MSYSLCFGVFVLHPQQNECFDALLYLVISELPHHCDSGNIGHHQYICSG